MTVESSAISSSAPCCPASMIPTSSAIAPAARTRLRFAANNAPPASPRRTPKTGAKPSNAGAILVANATTSSSGASRNASHESNTAPKSSVAPAWMKKIGTKNP